MSNISHLLYHTDAVALTNISYVVVTTAIVLPFMAAVRDLSFFDLHDLDWMFWEFSFIFFFEYYIYIIFSHR